MGTSIDQIEADWVQALDQAEADIKQVLAQLPHDRLREFTDDLTNWSKRLSDDTLARAYRVLGSLGYSRGAAATVLGISPTMIYRLTSPHPERYQRIKPRNDSTPTDFIDVTADFESMPR